MDPLSVGRSCYKQRDYEGALVAFTEASSPRLRDRGIIPRLDLCNRFFKWPVSHESHI